MSSQLRQHYDVIINGGGIVGFSLLNLIQRSPYLNRFKVLLIDQASKASSIVKPERKNDSSSLNQPNFSNRVSSITNNSRAVFKKIGVWDKIQQRSKCVKRIKVWNYEYRHKIIFGNNCRRDTINGNELDDMFSVVENNQLLSSLVNNLLDSSKKNFSIDWNHNLVSIENSTNSQGSVEIAVENLKTNEVSRVSGGLLLGCDGFKSKVRTTSGIPYFEKDLEKMGIVGTVKVGPKDRDERNMTAYQRFSAEKDTVAAILPLSEEYSSFVISSPRDYAKQLIDMDDNEFMAEFNDLLSRREYPNERILENIHETLNVTLESLSNLLHRQLPSKLPLNDDMDIECPYIETLVPGSRAAYPLIFGTTSPRMVASLPGSEDLKIALLGDSSHRVHPLAGQGLNLGIQDAANLVKQLDLIARTGENLFDLEDKSRLTRALKRYELERQAYIVPMSAGILAMPLIFKLLPSNFVSFANRLDVLKDASIKFANGF